MILHIDMDAFYASIEQRENPDLQGKAVIVGGLPEKRGVVCAASYEARVYGVRSAMPSATAVRLCPQAVFLPSRMSLYADVSNQIREIMLRYTPLVEPLALDEAFLDVRPCERLLGSAESVGKEIKNAIQSELQLTASVGVAPNKFLAKLASDVDKPNGFVVVPPERAHAFLDPLPVQRLWGVGAKAAERLERLGVKTILDLRRMPEEVLKPHLGDQAEHFLRLANGQDDRQVVPDRQAKSISHESTFTDDIDEMESLRKWLITLTEQVAWRLRRHALLGSTLQLKIRFNDFQTITRASKLSTPTNSTQPLCNAADALLHSALADQFRPVRLLGVGLTGLRSGDIRQQSLFDAEETAAQEKLDEAADAIRSRFGGESLRRASGLRSKRQ